MGRKLLSGKFGIKINKSKTKVVKSSRNISDDSLNIKMTMITYRRWMNPTTLVASQKMDEVKTTSKEDQPNLKEPFTKKKCAFIIFYEEELYLWNAKFYGCEICTI